MSELTAWRDEKTLAQRVRVVMVSCMDQEALLRLKGKHRVVLEELADLARRLGDLEADALSGDPWPLRQLYAANIRQVQRYVLKAELAASLPREILDGAAS